MKAKAKELDETKSELLKLSELKDTTPIYFFQNKLNFLESEIEREAIKLKRISDKEVELKESIEADREIEKELDSNIRNDETGKQIQELEKDIKSKDGNPFSEAKNFNLLFPVRMGASSETSTIAYLRGELAQGMFTNYKNVVDSIHPKLPFGLAQTGKAFRNEIAARDFIFRTRI